MNKKENKIKKFIIKNKVALSLSCVMLLVGVSVYYSFAYYVYTDTNTLIDGQVGYFENPDMSIKYMVENIDNNGEGTGVYTASWAAPKFDYVYNDATSYCTEGATYAKDGDDFIISASARTKCYFYYDSKGSDGEPAIKITVMKKVKGQNNYENANYYTLEGLTTQNFIYNSKSSYCTEGASIDYDEKNYEFDISTSSKTVCVAYFDQE